MMMRRTIVIVVAIALALAMAAGSQAATKKLVVPKGTVVNLAFDTAFNSKTASVGDKINLHVVENVVVKGVTVIARDTPVIGTISSVERRKRYGVNAKMRIVLNPVQSVFDKAIPVAARAKGDYVGARTGEAAGATIGGAAILGPLGLAGGYFVVGKNVNVKKGDLLSTAVTTKVKITYEEK